jgi:hypothetical protein
MFDLSEWFSVSWRLCGLASMYPASDWSGLSSGPSWKRLSGESGADRNRLHEALTMFFYSLFTAHAPDTQCAALPHESPGKHPRRGFSMSSLLIARLYS